MAGACRGNDKVASIGVSHMNGIYRVTDSQTLATIDQYSVGHLRDMVFEGPPRGRGIATTMVTRRR